MRSSRKNRLWIILLALIFALLVIAVVVTAVYLFIRQQPAATVSWQDPVSEISPEGVAPELALFPVAGALESETIDTAISNGELETAYAALAFGLSLSDAQRIGRLVLLGAAFVEADKADRAGLVYQQIYDLAILSPNLTDAARAEALLTGGGGWAALEQEADALEAYDQVYTIAVHSPYLQGAHRRDLFSSLAGAYEGIGAGEAAQRCQDRISELDQQTVPQLPALPPKLPDLPSGSVPVSSPEVGELEENRRQAAFALLQVIPEEGEPPADQVNALAEALRAEDAAKQALYGQELEATTQFSRRIDVRWHLIRWLTLKYQVAARAFGLSIVPEWEEQVADIQSALSTVYEDLLFDYEDLVTGLPDVSLIGPGSYQVRRMATLAGRLGQYPNYPEQPMADKIREAVNNLIAAGFVEQLYVDMTTDEVGLRFFLRPATKYGAPVQEP